MKKMIRLFVVFVFLLLATSTFAAWQGTSWVLTGETINSVKTKANFDYLYSLWKRTLNNLYYTEGFVGIGTTTPRASLHIDSPYNDKIRLSGTQTAPHTIFLEGTQGLRLWDDTNGELLRVTESGNVGIGTSSPQTKLDVAGAIKVSDTGAACSSNTKGAIKLNSTTNILEYCDGTQWKAIGTGVVGSSATTTTPWTTSGTTVFTGTAPTTFTPLDLSAHVGKKATLVMLKVQGGDNVFFRTNGDTADIYPGVSWTGQGTSATQASSGGSYVLVQTDSNGVVEWKASSATNVTITLHGFVNLGASGSSCQKEPLFAPPFPDVINCNDVLMYLELITRPSNPDQICYYNTATQGGVPGVICFSKTTYEINKGSWVATATYNCPLGKTLDQIIADGQAINFGQCSSGTTGTSGSDNDWTISGIDMYSSVSGNVGVGTNSPQVKLDVAGAIKVSDTGAACSSNTKGAIKLNSITSILEYCDGTEWKAIGSSGGAVIGDAQWKTVGTVYQADTDGIIVFYNGGNGSSNAEGYACTWDTNPGASAVCYGNPTRKSYNRAMGYNGATLPVKKGDYWKVEHYTGGGYTYAYFVPLIGSSSTIINNEPVLLWQGAAAPNDYINLSDAWNNYDALLVTYTYGTYSNDWDTSVYLPTKDLELGKKYLLNMELDERMFLKMITYTTLQHLAGGNWTSDNRIYKIYGVNFSSLASSGSGTDNDWIISGNNMYSTVSGSVGIGTQTPSSNSKLHVQNDSGHSVIKVVSPSGNDSTLQLYSDSLAGWALVKDRTSSDFYINYDDTDSNAEGTALAISRKAANQYNIGIGTTAPSGTLAIERYDSARPIWYGKFIIYPDSDFSDAGEIVFDGGSDGVFSIANIGSGSGATWFKSVDPDTNVHNYILTLQNNGNVGIGTTTPSAKLHVNGDVKIEGNNTLEFGAGIAGKEVNAGKIGYQVWSTDALDIVGAGADATNRKIRFWNEGGATFGGPVSINTFQNTGFLNIAALDAGPNSAGDGASIVIGDVAGLHLEIDNNELHSMNGNGVATLFVNNDGGNIIMLANSAGNGRVGIGTEFPGSLLEVKGDSWFPLIINSTNTSGVGGGGIAIHPNDFNKRIEWAVTANGDARLWMDGEKIWVQRNTGNVGIGTNAPAERLDVNGIARAVAFVYTSDRRLKTDIRTINGLSLINKLRGVEFKWKKTGEKSMGLIAQEVEKVAPELVREDPNTGIKSVLYGNIVAPLIEAVKELHSLFSDLQKFVKTMYARLLDTEELANKNSQKILELETIIRKQQEQIERLKAELDSLRNK